jgi:hypothetical protein
MTYWLVAHPDWQIAAVSSLLSQRIHIEKQGWPGAT